MAKILVTGGMGYIGSHTTVELINKGYEVVIADDLSNSEIDTLSRIEKICGARPTFEKIDLKNMAHVLELFQDHRFNGVIHFAASKAVGESVAKPLKYYRNNLMTLINVLEAMKLTGTENIVFSSSATVYGQPEVLPVTEDSPFQKAASPYGNTKQIGEEIIEDSTNAYDRLKGISLRYFNPVGAHESALIGELPLGTPNNLMPFITQTAIGKLAQLKVFGTDYETKDGTCIRDYIHVVDLAKAHVNAVERMLEEKMTGSFEFFNLGTGNGQTVLEVINSFEKTSGEKLNYILAERRAGDVEKIWAEPTKANQELNWDAKLDLDVMTASAWKWEKHLADATAKI
ncbi:UDP-glucose 4-epimerase GalE [Sediminitomix flava]|uniref:UDP-glucose 4-epimerase n=1 Tax=Sediminitomix flava TaxID=379075 RepID=A0A315ZEV2_SEDFL|nr:UDP-glucose 4-epimerase GalE [Sediminitomix flava]PWJ43690.1 UDP-glucose 4-epimerase [Sediminitomix flava]